MRSCEKNREPTRQMDLMDLMDLMDRSGTGLPRPSALPRPYPIRCANTRLASS